jgi:hypothetical protein
MEKRESNLQEEKDPHLNIPSEANTDKHINFLDAEDNGDKSGKKNKDDEIKECQKQWKEGLEEGRRAAEGE